MTSERPALDRRRFLIALGLAPTVAVLTSCNKNDKPKQLIVPDMSGSDPAIRPQDDLYRFVNGKWLKEYQLPPDKVSFGTFDEVQERVQQQLKEIIEGIRDPKSGSDEQKIRDLYDGRMDKFGIEKLGMTPLQDLFDQIDKAAAKPDLARVMGGLPGVGLIGIGVGPDPKDSNAYLPAVSQAGLGLDQQYYSDPKYADKLAKYRTFMEQIAAGAGFPDPTALAGRVVELEKRIAGFHWDNVKLRDTDATYNLKTWAELTALGPQFDWDPWLSGTTDRPKNLFDKIDVGEPSFITGAAGLWAEVDIAAWREYLKLGLVRAFAAYLPKAIADPNFDFFGKEMSGLKQRPDLWKAAVSTVNGTVGEALGKLYVDKHFPPAAKQRALEMVGDLRAAYKENFQNSTWMSPPTRAAAIVKLEKIDAKIGYPDKWEDYSKLTVTRGKLVDSLRAADTFEAKRMFDRLGTKVDKSEWGMPPQTVNAYYNASGNEIVFPAAFLQPPFFDPDAEPAVNYGAGGAVIGHEIGHGFDDQGAKYDADGNLKDWWTPEDKAAFQAKTQQLIDQYNALAPEGLGPDQHVNGELTVGENLADLRGLEISLAAYRMVEKRKGIDAPDYKPMFESWGRTWRTKMTDQALENQLANDPHSPAEFRCDQVVKNLAEFYSTYGVKEGDKEYLPPDQRVTL
ncbi:M13 family metallopeptidase [Nocardia seriolae]|uniref:Endothelin-converting enzyme-like n=1 Tax=Nocardia seriolae TaxID=37332 RepID=A0A0B8NQV1_9NOCA|nr:M13 family metallopeptidase [Nocardia seriolae]APB01612.1 Endothelin-converting enzyme-like [Nocardia seriolae]MTJ60915.1 M13 family peptidase [Nocardia seriolae]MTJ75302.1 M13 family peptidase [Nocardia seriolae]MTJ90950.1 M13 family peptidase [Nocardia seriolae]MTK34907.1 M13 family peptidase [Nocardia seriolae]